jgi:thiol peroxidase
MSERKGAVTFQGNPLTLTGDELKVGDKAPNVKLMNDELKPVALDDYNGKVCVLLSVPSLDTPVCDTETRKFNEYAGTFGQDVQVLAVSMDLPFAQKRWCGASGVERVTTLSDYRDRQFGEGFGLYIKELGLLARAVHILDREGVVRYRQLVTEITSEPDYDEVREAVADLVK